MLSIASRCFGQVHTGDSKREYLCSIVGSCLCLTMVSDTNPYGCRCAVATREKTAMLSLRTFVLFTLHALLNAIIRCLQLNTGWCRGCNPEGGLLVIDAVGLTVYVFCVMPAYLFIVFILEIIVQGALSVNCPSVICLPSMYYLYGETPLVNCGSRNEKAIRDENCIWTCIGINN